MKQILSIAVLIALILTLAAGCEPSPAAPSATASAVPTLPPSTAGLPLEPAALVTPADNPIAVPVLETPVPTLALTPLATFTPDAVWPPPSEKRTRYTLTARLDYNRHTLAVEERIEYINTTPGSLGELPLMVDALRYPLTFELAGVTDTAGKPLRTKVKDATLRMTLPAALEPGESVQFTLLYTLALPDVTRLPELRPYPLGYTSTAANFGDWYPFVPPYVEGKGWLIHPPAMYGEYLAYDVSDFDVFILAFSTVVGAASTLPGGLGAAEASIAGMVVVLLGLPADIAAAATLLIRFATLWFGISLGLAVWLKSPDLLGLQTHD